MQRCWLLMCEAAGSGDAGKAWERDDRHMDLLRLRRGGREHHLPVLVAFAPPHATRVKTLRFHFGVRYLKVRAYLIIFQRRRTEFGLGSLDQDAYSVKHNKRLQDAQKGIKTTHANLLAGGLEDAPFGVLGLL
jgi:hypothetical protein